MVTVTPSVNTVYNPSPYFVDVIYGRPLMNLPVELPVGVSVSFSSNAGTPLYTVSKSLGSSGDTHCAPITAARK